MEMAVQKKSKLAERLGAKLKKAHAAHKSDETVYSAAGDLPDGIENGIAKLVSINFGVYASGKSKGKDYFMAQGVVVSPKEHNDVPVEGLRTSIGPEPLCDTPESKGKKTTFEDHYSWVLNELRKLGLNTDEIEGEDLEAACASLVESEIYFRFRTWKGTKTAQFPDPKTNHEWRGIVENYSPEEGEEQVEDNTEEEGEEEEAGEEEETSEDIDSLVEAAEGGDEDAQAKLLDMAVEAGHDKKEVNALPSWQEVADLINGATLEEGETEEEEAEEEAEESEEEDLEALGSSADEGDEEAIARLTELAGEQEIDPDEYPTWAELAAALTGEEAGEEEAEEAEEEEEAVEWKPAKGDVYRYKPLDPKTKKKVKAAVDCEVVSIDTKKKTFNLKNLDTEKLYPNVSWDAIEAD